MADETRTALGSAHERFVAGLPERGHELRALAQGLEASVSGTAPALRSGAVLQDDAAAEQLMRRLQALYASSRVFDHKPLVNSLRAVIETLEAARAALRAPTRAELASVLLLCRELGAEGGPMRADRAEAARPSEPRDDRLRAVPASDRPAAISQTVAGTLAAAEDVLAILILASPAVEHAVREALPVDQCDFTSTSDPDTALAALDQLAPDAVLVEARFVNEMGATLVQALRGARAAGVHAVIALVPELRPGADAVEGRAELSTLVARSGADAALRLPLERSRLYERLLRYAGRVPRPPFGVDAIASGTVEEIARGVAEEIRRGIADSLRLGRGEHIELTDRSELLAAAWSAVARIRVHLAETAAGRVRFDDAPYSEGPAALALTDDLPAAPYVGVGDTIRGRRIVLADDDPAVLWFFAGLLREAGAIAIEARNGKQALEEVRRRPPDLLISDILMPEIDGFTLCRELKRDLALAHVPVILLSWKEDFLQRMRELDAGASGYLRKEAGSLQILVTVADALRPRAELSALLAMAGEVQGRVDAVGVPALLQAVASQRGDACVTVRDAWNLFEIDVRGGSALRVTRTAADGSFVRGASALRQLFGVHVGRFTIEQASTPVRGMFDEPVDKLIADGVCRLGAVMDAVSDHRLMRVARAGFDDEVLGPLLTATPTVLADVAVRLRAGESPRQLVLSGAYAPREVEQHLRELARRGAIVTVWGEGEEDLVDAALRAREAHPGTLLHAAERPSRVPPAPIALAEGDVEWIERRAAAAAAGAGVAPPPMPKSTPRPPPWVDPAQHSATAQEAPAPERAAAPDAVSSERLPAETPPAAAPPPEAQRRSQPPARATRESEPPQPFSVQSALLRDSAEATTLRIASMSAPARGLAAWRFVLTLAVLVALGFFGWRAFQPEGSVATRKAAPRQPPPVEHVDEAPRSTTSPAPAEPDEVTARAPTSSDLGRVLPFIDRGRGIDVAADQGLLVVQFDGRGAPPRVRADARDLGSAPLAAALSAGRHELMLKRDEHTSVRFFVLRAGETQIVEIHD